MVQTADRRRSFYLQLLPAQIQPHQVLNLEIVHHGYGDQALYQQSIMSLGTDVQLPEICDAQDITIAVIEGNGTLTVNDEIVTLEPGVFVFIPANTYHMLQTQSQLIFLLNRCRPDPDIGESSWIINL
ncbi:cupin domain-containing protein [Myxacorys almedinensis]|uniref:Cupin domain-containing protein n=1 Tax=Myxacorys almedinensis A TaxID=2690445 RepID=A0A8J7Z1B8_9CYAN|nr:cupin domain-containing protein [Myxacorys almedinensis]NDJ17365.1 cupin domain-containing protein [Myxacorys almedinensis A]